MTEREIVERERRAARWAMREFGRFSVREIESIRELEIAARFPLPKVTRPRVMTDSAGYEWRLVDSTFEWRLTQLWHRITLASGPSWDPTPERVRVWADLLANPTEEVDA